MSHTQLVKRNNPAEDNHQPKATTDSAAFGVVRQPQTMHTGLNRHQTGPNWAAPTGQQTGPNWAAPTGHSRLAPTEQPQLGRQHGSN